MSKISIGQVPEFERSSPKRRFSSRRRDVTKALSIDPSARLPYDVQWVTLPPGAALCPFHAHSAEWEHYIFISGEGRVRHPGGVDSVGPGDHAFFPPGEAHQILNESNAPLTYYVIANNPEGSDNCYYPDSDKWALHFEPGGGIVRAKSADYFEGEE